MKPSRTAHRQATSVAGYLLLIVTFLISTGCRSEKSASDRVKNAPAALLDASPAASLARNSLRQGVNLHVHASSPSVFFIFAKTDAGDLVSGTCFYFSGPKGRWIITANHVISEAAPDSIVARVGDASVKLRVVSQDAASDLAALLPSQTISNAPLRLRATSAQKGERVTFTGFPIPDVLGASSPATVQGPVVEDTDTVGGKADFKIAAPATGGDSGSPVLDAEEAVVGVVIYATSDRRSAYAVDGFNILKLLGEVRP